MGISIKDITQLGIEIMKFTPAAPFVPIASGLATLLPGKSDDEKKLREVEWKMKHIIRWKLMARQLMDIPMSNERKGIALQGRMWAEWFDAFGEPPKDEWIEDLHENVVRSVKAFMATEGLG